MAAVMHVSSKSFIVMSQQIGTQSLKRGWALTIPEATHVEIEYVSRLLTSSNSPFDPVKFEKASPLRVLSVEDHTSSQGNYSHPHIL
jgi:hypothetical protein